MRDGGSKLGRASEGRSVRDRTGLGMAGIFNVFREGNGTPSRQNMVVLNSRRWTVHF